MARQGHGFVTSLPIRVVRTDTTDPSSPSEELVDVARDGRELGEIVFFGNICAKGYYKDPEATRKLFLGGGLHSGDLAVMHPDGSAQIQDRSKDIIISGASLCLSLFLSFPRFLRLAYTIHVYEGSVPAFLRLGKKKNKNGIKSSRMNVR